MDELTRDPLQQLGGFRSLLHRALGEQSLRTQLHREFNENRGQLFQQSFEEGKKYQHPLSEQKGYESGYRVGESKGIEIGAKTFMTQGDKYVALLHNEEKPLVFPTMNDLYKSDFGNDLFKKALVDKEVGKTFEYSIFYGQLQNEIEPITKEQNKIQDKIQKTDALIGKTTAELEKSLTIQKNLLTHHRSNLNDILSINNFKINNKYCNNFW